MNRRTSRSTSEEQQEVRSMKKWEIKHTIGMKFHKFKKKITLCKEIKQKRQ